MYIAILSLLGLNLLAMLVVIPFAFAMILFAICRPLWRSGWRVKGVLVSALLLVLLCLGVGIVLRPVVVARWNWLSSDGGNEPVLFALRDVYLDSGVSPILSALVLGVGFFSLGWLGLRWLELQRVKLPQVEGAGQDHVPTWGKRLKTILDEIASGTRLENALMSPLGGWPRIALTAIVLMVLALQVGEIFHRWVPTLEHSYFDYAFTWAFGLNLLMLAWVLARFVTLWWGLSTLLRQIVQLPLAAALKRLPERARLLFGRFFRADPDLDAGWEMFEQATEDLLPAGELLNEPAKRLEKTLPELVTWWGTLPLSRDSSSSQTKGASGHPPEEKATDYSTPYRRWMERVEDALALYLVLRLRTYALALRQMARALAIGPALLLLAMTSYPFQPQQLTTTLIWTFILLALGAILMIHVGVNRDEFVSRVSETTPNAVTSDWAFASNVLARVVPALTVFLIAFPGISYWLKSVLGPLSRALR